MCAYTCVLTHVLTRPIPAAQQRQAEELLLLICVPLYVCPYMCTLPQMSLYTCPYKSHTSRGISSSLYVYPYMYVLIHVPLYVCPYMLSFCTCPYTSHTSRPTKTSSGISSSSTTTASSSISPAAPRRTPTTARGRGATKPKRARRNFLQRVLPDMSSCEKKLSAPP